MHRTACKKIDGCCQLSDELLEPKLNSRPLITAWPRENERVFGVLHMNHSRMGDEKLGHTWCGNGEGTLR
jgi:hypothetical protein